MIGQTLGHYRIESKLGEGGMGAVWKARDTRLDRFVALKTLPADKLADEERRRRFVQEAKAASALNHPNIVHIYDIADADAVPFIAMEYVAGKTLDQLIGRKGLPLGELLKYAVQIADALARAHSAGIIHRDLKPSNIIVDEHGLVKVLDFGLAKLTETGTGELGETATVRAPEGPNTEEGTIVGTVAYMSPEQAEGKKVDARSDIFSFGSVLYEMVAGRRAFHGDSKLSTLSAILKEDPTPVNSLVPDVPRDLEKIISHCLRKDPGRRFQHMDDLRVALLDLKDESDSGKLSNPLSTVPTTRRHVWAWSAGLLAVLAAVAVAAIWFGRSRGSLPETALEAVPLTSYPGFQGFPTFSPDGNQVAFCWDGEKQDNADIYVKLVGSGGQPLRLTTNAAGDCQPAWSPDGRSIAFLRGLPRGRAAVLLMSALGGSERKLAEISESSESSAPAWSPDGKWLVLADDINFATEPPGLVALSIETGEKRRLTNPLSGRDSNPAFSPDGRALAFARSQSRDTSTGLLADVFVLALTKDVRAAAEPRRITFDTRYTSGLAWTDDGREILLSSGPFQGSDLRRVAADGSGTPQRLTSLGTRVSYPTIARHGGHLAYMRTSYDNNIWRVEVPDVFGRPHAPAPKAAPFIASTRIELDPDFSPDGKRIAFSSGRTSPEGKSEIWVCDSDGSNPVQFTSLDAFSGTPRWSPDGESIAFDSDVGGKWGIFVVSSNGGKPRRLTSVSANDDAPSWSRDGKWIYFVSDRNGAEQVWKMPAEGGAGVQVTKKGGTEAAESFDGKTLYYAKGRSATSLWKVPVGGGEETQVLESLSYLGNFAVVNSGIYFTPTPHTIQLFSFATGKIRSIAISEKGAGPGLTISPDHRWILYTQTDQSATELMLVENFR